MKKFKHKIINIDEAFENVFDSSLIDYSEDFNKADERHMMNDIDAFTSFYVHTAKKNESVLLYAATKILKASYLRCDDFAFDELEKAMESIFEYKPDLKPAEVILDWMRWVRYLKSELVSTDKLYYPKYRFWGNAFTGHGWDKEYEALDYILDKWFYMLVNSVESYKNVFDEVMKTHPIYRNLFLEIEETDSKMNEAFENVFDSSLIDYSKDFERQDLIQKDINDTLEYLKHTMDYWISDGDMGEEIDELGYSTNMELKMQKGVLIINLLIDWNDDDLYNYFSHVLFRMRKKEDYSPEKDEKVFNLLTKNKIKVNVIDTEQNNKVVKRNLDYVFRYYEPTEAYWEWDEDEDKPLSEDEVENDYDGVPMHINFELQNKLADITYGVQ